MYCKDCKFYKYKETDQIIDGVTYKVIKDINKGICKNNNIRYAWQLENDSQLIYHDSDDYSATLYLIYHDSDDYSATLYVGELFGCVHFKELEL